MDRFFVERALEVTVGSELTLSDRESHHLRVKRLAPGDRVRLFDEGGREVAGLVLDPRETARPLRDALAGPKPADVLLLVGPEGGFEDAEVAAAAARGFVPARLGRTVLRIETAAIAALAAITVAYAE